MIIRAVMLVSILMLPAMYATAADPLQQAWNAYISGLNEAQRSLFAPQFFPPEANGRNRAEGHRYLIGHIVREAELQMRAHPHFPEFLRSMDMLRKWTGENPDTAYLKARIDDTGYYRVTGQVENAIEWRTSERGIAGPKAPRLITFQTITNFPGGTGELQEMANCRSQTLDFINSMQLTLDSRNQFEILVGPERPDGYTGNFILSRKEMQCAATGESAIARAQWLSLRIIYSDWENEEPPRLNIVRLDKAGASREPISEAWMIEQLHHMAEEIPHQVQFWQLLQALALEVYQDVNRDGRRAMPVNGINPPSLPFTAAGVAGAKQLYASGVFELDEDQALVIKVTAPVEPHYISLQLSNLWFEGPDQQNYVSSLTGHQLPVASDGSRYYVISHRDPGVPGWVATTGLTKGTHTIRFVFREDPPAEKQPAASAILVSLDQVRKHLPADTPRITPDQRKAQIAVRQAHIKHRWRSY